MCRTDTETCSHYYTQLWMWPSKVVMSNSRSVTPMTSKEDSAEEDVYEECHMNSLILDLVRALCWWLTPNTSGLLSWYFGKTASMQTTSDSWCSELSIRCRFLFEISLQIQMTVSMFMFQSHMTSVAYKCLDTIWRFPWEYVTGSSGQRMSIIATTHTVWRILSQHCSYNAVRGYSGQWMM